jgi:hypothetical protein
VLVTYTTPTPLERTKKTNSVALSPRANLPTELQPFVNEIFSANFGGQRGVVWSARRISYGR